MFQTFDVDLRALGSTGANYHQCKRSWVCDMCKRQPRHGWNWHLRSGIPHNLIHHWLKWVCACQIWFSAVFLGSHFESLDPRLQNFWPTLLPRAIYYYSHADILFQHSTRHASVSTLVRHVRHWTSSWKRCCNKSGPFSLKWGVSPNVSSVNRIDTR